MKTQKYIERCIFLSSQQEIEMPDRYLKKLSLGHLAQRLDREIRSYALKNGIRKTSEEFGIEPETARRLIGRTRLHISEEAA